MSAMKDPPLSEVEGLMVCLRAVDQDLFRRQRKALMDVARMPILSSTNAELLDGLNEVLDFLTDFMSDSLGMEGVLLTAELDKEKAQTEVQKLTHWVGARVVAIKFDEMLASPPPKGTKGTVKAVLPREEDDAYETIRLDVAWDNGARGVVVFPPDVIEMARR